MTTTLIIARHGNTFEDGEPPRRVGRRTDLPLTEKGRAQARAIGQWLKDNRLIPDVVYSSTLQRTIETAKLAVEASGVKQPVFPLAIFDEIDYGPDENKTEAEVVARIGKDAIRRWDTDAAVPPGWQADPATILRNWQAFADSIRAHEDKETVLVVTSNGIARFARRIASNPDGELKLAPGALALLNYKKAWTIEEWNIRPPLHNVSS